MGLTRSTELNGRNALFELLDRQLNRLGVLTGDLANLLLLLRSQFDANLILRHIGLLGVERGLHPVSITGPI